MKAPETLEEYLDTKVTKIGKRWHVRLINVKRNEVLDEHACEYQEDIGYCVHQMLGMHDRCGGLSPMAMASRDRGKHWKVPKGKIWHWNDLEREREKRKKEKTLHLSR